MIVRSLHALFLGDDVMRLCLVLRCIVIGDRISTHIHVFMSLELVL